jgi:predicted lipid-binding transport protein (Tim44 family)
MNTGQETTINAYEPTANQTAVNRLAEETVRARPTTLAPAMGGAVGGGITAGVISAATGTPSALLAVLAVVSLLLLLVLGPAVWSRKTERREAALAVVDRLFGPAGRGSS